jgi:hypothetical protein
MSSGVQLTEADIRRIVREEIETAFSLVMLGDREAISAYASESLTCDEAAERVDLALKRHQSAEQSGDSELKLSQPSRGSGLPETFRLDSVRDGLSDGQIVGDLIKERDEFHASPSLDGVDSQSVGDGRPGPAEESGPGQSQGGAL